MTEKPTRNLQGIRVFASIGALISAYLLWRSLEGGHIAGCGAATSCEEVLSSRWAYWLGMPVSALGLLVHLSVLATTFSATAENRAPTREKARTLLSLAACLEASAAAWFLALQFFVLGELCPYCIAAHVSAIASAAFIFSVTGNPFRNSAVRTGTLLGVATLIAGQWFSFPPEHEVQSAPAARLTTGRQFDIFDGRFKINLDKVPVLGEPNAPTVMVNLFDYTCPHCRRMHGLLLAAEEAHRGALAIADLPMPLDAACNRLVRETAPKHVNGCHYARLGLAVWRADRGKMSRFNFWLFDPVTPPGLDSALGYASELVGEEALKRALNDSWIREQLDQDIAIYETTSQHFGNTAMPQMIIGTKVVFGELAGGMDDLERLLGEILGPTADR